MADESDAGRVDELMEEISQRAEAVELLRCSDSAVLIYNGPDRAGWVYVGAQGPLDVLLVQAAHQELAEAVLGANVDFWVGDDVEEEEDEEEETYGDEDDRFSL